MLRVLKSHSVCLVPDHLGLFIAWGMLYALFNGLQAFWTHDTVYFFFDLTLAKAPFVGAFLFCLMCAIFSATCALSRLKWSYLERPRSDLTATLLPPEPERLLEASRKLWSTPCADASSPLRVGGVTVGSFTQASPG